MLKDCILFKEKVLSRWEFIVFQDTWMVLIQELQRSSKFLFLLSIKAKVFSKLLGVGVVSFWLSF